MLKVKEETEKVVLKLNIQKTKVMASSPITSWQIDGETVETMRYFFGRDWWQEEKAKKEDEMAGLHHRLDGHEFE